ncbi:MAG: FliH/SctL family protein [Azospirillaceae bacterium]|nr:FliH/SctL family protein [Azospirillaceae bacterium]
MTNIRRFLFDNSFDPEGRRVEVAVPEAVAEPERPPEPPPPPPPPPEPTFTLAELQQQVKIAREGAYAQGHAEGVAAGTDQTQKALTEVLAKAQAGIAQLLDAHMKARIQRSVDTTRLSLAIVRKLFPTLAKRHGLGEVEGTVSSFLAELADEPRLLVRVHESYLAPIKEKIEEMAARQGFGGSVAVVADPKAGELDCRADWGDGGAERDISAIWAEIDRIAGHLTEPLEDGRAAAE